MYVITSLGMYLIVADQSDHESIRGGKQVRDHYLTTVHPLPPSRPHCPNPTAALLHLEDYNKSMIELFFLSH